MASTPPPDSGPLNSQMRPDSKSKSGSFQAIIVPGLQHLSTLPTAQREGLPPLRLSMHVYDPDPAARFVLIDGKRYRQGETIATDIVVDAIRPDGVAIKRGQQRFLISRP